MELNINGLKYKVIFVEQVSVDNCVGFFDSERQIIEIKKSLSNKQKIKTFLHELTHAYVWCYGFSDAEFNYETVSNFMSAYFEMINKDLQKFIKNQIKGR